MALGLVRYQLSDGEAVLVEVDRDSPGYERVARDADDIVQAGKTLESTLRTVVPTARAVINSLADLKASAVEVEFGIKLSGEASILVAKTSMEGHFNVRLAFHPGAAQDK